MFVNTSKQVYLYYPQVQFFKLYLKYTKRVHSIQLSALLCHKGPDPIKRVGLKKHLKLKTNPKYHFK